MTIGEVMRTIELVTGRDHDTLAPLDADCVHDGCDSEVATSLPPK